MKLIDYPALGIDGWFSFLSFVCVLYVAVFIFIYFVNVLYNHVDTAMNSFIGTRFIFSLKIMISFPLCMLPAV